MDGILSVIALRRELQLPNPGQVVPSAELTGRSNSPAL
jgi:hypothetical protein